MKQFFKFIFASCLGVILASGVVFLIGALVVSSLAGKENKPKSIHPNTLLKISFNQPIPELTNNLEMNPFDLKNQQILGLNDIVKTIEYAKTDNKIKGILLDLQSLGTGVATASVLRDALLDFKESGKFIVANSKYYTQGSYYIASVADKVYLNPFGSVDFHGIAAMVPFFKKMMDKIGVKMQVFYAGDFKSATEPFRRYDMSEKNKLQLREYLEPVYTKYLSDIGESRNKTVAELRAIADGLKVGNADDAVALGLVDAAAFKDELIADLKERMGLDEKDKLQTVSLSDYSRNARKKKDYSIKDKIAVVFAEGSIVVGKGEPGSIGDDKYTKILRKLRKDDKVKAIVLRVNSGGGSALSSENILREVTLAKEAGKKVVVSMGDYAASGGYYISCGADKIVAEPNTLTGSIGVFMMVVNASQLLNDKLGISFDTVKTTRYSTGLNSFFELSEGEQKMLQASTLDIYEKFLKRVADGRHMTRDDVHKIAQGRIWTGIRAKEIGLVDELGGLDDAIKIAADLSGLEKYRPTYFPKMKEPLQQFIEELTGKDEGISARVLQKELGQYYPYYSFVKEVTEMKGVQARLPVLIEFR